MQLSCPDRGCDGSVLSRRRRQEYSYASHGRELRVRAHRCICWLERNEGCWGLARWPNIVCGYEALDTFFRFRMVIRF